MKVMHMWLQTLGGITIGFGLCASAGAQTLSGEQIQKALSDKRVSLSCADGTNGTGRYTMGRNFGTIRGNYRRAGAPPEQDVGQVRASGSQVCLRFNKLNKGEENCFGVTQRGAGRFQFTALCGFVGVCEVRVI